MNADEKSLALATAALFIGAFIPALIGGVMFTGRKMLGWTRAQSRRWLYTERSLWIAGMILLTAGFALFADVLRIGRENVFSRLGLIGFLFGAVLIVVAEAHALDTQAWSDYMVRLSVTILLLSEAIFGMAVLQTQLLPQWIGWATIVWNVGWLVLLFRAKDPYFPALHYIMPLITGILLIGLAQ